MAASETRPSSPVSTVSPLLQELTSLLTEQNNPATWDIDLSDTQRILELINAEDCKVAPAVAREIPSIAAAVDHIVAAFYRGGRLIYVGAGTSGRLGIIDAAECPPTFGSPPEMVQAIIAGGDAAIFRAQEGAEDRREDGAAAIAARQVTANDVVCGIAASARTPFVLGALEEAHRRGATTILITTNPRQKVQQMEIARYAHILICPEVGPEVIAGSTRMKSGTAQKLVLNMLTTAAMIRIGKTYHNIMVDLQPTNQKLLERSKHILMLLADVDYATAEHTLRETQGNTKLALFMLLANLPADQARRLLQKHQGRLREALLARHTER
ncbi:MAG: N-acetylmuramic acid 6-phosphate etherase [Candidatus Kapabacteria bacterium]|nr:N-acetylmuramic acid 6-phosphate etherase [Candidatus Kapabacteria bacterium]MDW8224656.1 N-acetylmuramic acid 6-phosphate etherase [Bacteroidota bacterium]